MERSAMVTFPFFGLRVRVMPSALLGTLLLLILLGVVAALLMALSVPQVLLAALLGTLAHWLSVLLHHLGHAISAGRSGHPMRSVRLWGILGTSEYPPDNSLPARVHILRASGGPLLSLIVSALLLLAWFALPATDVLRFVLGWALLDNLLIFTIGAVIPPVYLRQPIEFANDGGTILYWLRPERRDHMAD